MNYYLLYVDWIERYFSTFAGRVCLKKEKDMIILEQYKKAI